MGKGSVPRPYSVPKNDFDSKWEAIFGKRDIKEQSRDKPTPKQDDQNTNAK
jgi:hypothetical protein